MIVGLFLLVAVVLQTQTTSGPCSPIAPNNSGSVTINCPGINKAQADELTKIINKLLANQTDLKQFGNKLDEILKAVDALANGRSVTQMQKDAMAAVLAVLPTEVIPITTYASAEDGLSYGQEIGTGILMGHWDVQGRAVNRAIATPFDNLRGVAILVHDKDHPPAKALSLQRALKAADITAPILTDTSQDTTGLVLWIGRR